MREPMNARKPKPVDFVDEAGSGVNGAEPVMPPASEARRVAYDSLGSCLNVHLVNSCEEDDGDRPVANICVSSGTFEYVILKYIAHEHLWKHHGHDIVASFQRLLWKYSPIAVRTLHEAGIQCIAYGFIENGALKCAMLLAGIAS